MKRRIFLLALMPMTVLRAEGGSDSIRGKLIRGANGTPAIRTADGREIPLQGDAATLGVLRDDRVIGSEFEAVGTLQGERLAINPIHTRAMFVHKDGKRLMVTYWCDVCYIRTYTPGRCWCCQDDTKLDLIERASES